MFRSGSNRSHSICVTTAYGKVLEAAEVSDRELPSALRRFHDLAVRSRNAVVTLNGVVQTRNAFLEFVRHFNASAGPEAQGKQPSPAGADRALQLS